MGNIDFCIPIMLLFSVCPSSGKLNSYSSLIIAR